MKTLDEQTVLTSDNGALTLTNYRVKFEEKNGATSRAISITLDSVASCGLVTRDNPTLKILAGLLIAIAAVGFFSKTDFGQNAPLIALIGLAFALAYHLTKSAVITISSTGNEAITVPAKGMKRENILQFVEAVTEEKIKFIGGLQK